MKSRLRPAVATAAVLAVAGFSAAAFAAPAQATTATTGETGTTLPFPMIADMKVAATAGHIFVTGGRDTTYIDVLNLDGTPDTTIPAVDPSDMVLSADGSTLYVSTGQGQQGAILAIDTSTLAVKTTYATPNVPYSLALTAGYLWMSYASVDGLAQLDLSTGTVSATDAQTVSYGANLQTSAAAPDILLMTTATSAEQIDVYNVAGGTPTYVTGTQTLGLLGAANFCGQRTTLTATDVLVACGTRILAYNLADFALDTTYVATTDEGNIYDVQIAPSGQIAASVWTLDGVSSIAYFEPSVDAPVSTYGDWQGNEINSMGWSTDGEVSYFAFESGEANTLITVRPQSTLNVDFPGTALEGSPMTGSVSSGGTAPYSGTVTVTKGDFIGNVAVVPVAPDGSFSFVDKEVLLTNPTYYTVSYSGDAEHTSSSATPIVQYIQAIYPLKGGHPATTARLVTHDPSSSVAMSGGSGSGSNALTADITPTTTLGGAHAFSADQGIAAQQTSIHDATGPILGAQSPMNLDTSAVADAKPIASAPAEPIGALLLSTAFAATAAFITRRRHAARRPQRGR